MSNTKLIKLNGTLIKSDGTEAKSNYFKFLELQPDDYSDIAFSPEEAQRIRTHLQHLSTGASAVIPLYCGGVARCPFIAACPLARIDEDRKLTNPDARSVLPVGRRCVVETNLINEWTRLYLMEYEVDEHSFTEIQLVRELAEIELMLWRLNNNLAKPENAGLVQDTVVGVDREGRALTRKEISSIFEAKERLINRKTKLIKLMVGDRQEKYKRDAALKTRDEGDPSTSAAQLRGRINSLLKEAERSTRALQEAEGNMIDVDAKTSEIAPEDLFEED